MSSASREYMEQAASELGVPKQMPIPTVSDAYRLTRLVNTASIRNHVKEQPTTKNPTALCEIVSKLVHMNAKFEPDNGELFFCAAAEWHFFNALANPTLQDGRGGDYEQTVIYTHNGQPVVLTKGEPHGKLASIVCAEIPDDPRFVEGMVGRMYSSYGFTPRFVRASPGVVLREIQDNMNFSNARPSTLVAFPLEVRRNLLNPDSELSGAYAEVHRQKTIQDLALAAARLVDDYK